MFLFVLLEVERFAASSEESSSPKKKRGPGRPPRDPNIIHKCTECGKIFKNSDFLRLHRRIHKERTHECLTCQKSFHRPYDLKIHSRVHNKERLFKCDKCGTQFAKKQTLDFHIKREKCLGNPNTCRICKRTFQTNMQLTTHLQSHGNQANKHEGGKCLIQIGVVDATQKQTKAEAQSMKSVPISPDKQLQKNTTQKQFSKSSEEVEVLSRKKKRTKKLFKCEDCDLVLCSKPNLISHVLSCHSDPSNFPFECEVCFKRFPVKTRLNWHFKVHTGEKPHECPTCKKQFRLKLHLKVHLQTHTGELPFECQDCHKRFGQKGHLVSHARTHSGETPYACSQCEKTYPRYDSLRRHINACHTIVSSDS